MSERLLKDTKLSMCQIFEIIQLGGFLELLGPLMKVRLTLMKNILTPLAKIGSISL